MLGHIKYELLLVFCINRSKENLGLKGFARFPYKHSVTRGRRRWPNASTYVSVVGSLMDPTSSVSLTLTIHLLSACH